MTKKTVSMKKIYIKPDMMVVELQTRNKLLVGSNTEEIYSKRYRSEGTEDDWDDL